MMYWNSSPTPWPACVDASRSAIMMPVSAQTNDVAMNSPIFTLRDRDADVAGGVRVAADAEDPVADARARRAPRSPSAVIAIHHSTVMRKSCGDQKLPPKILFALS